MNEAVLTKQSDRIATQRRTEYSDAKADSDFKLYLLLALLAVAGYLWSDWNLISPRAGFGYWLGVVGGSLMLFLLLYPLRKRLRLLQLLGSSRQWFRLHLLLGLLGPLMVLYHSNFSLGSFNSRVGMYSMLLVVGSGIIGRHIYAGIHRGLYGRKTSLQELQNELAQSIENSNSLAGITPRLVARLTEMSAELQGCEVTQSLGFGRSLRWSCKNLFVRFSLFATARSELRVAAVVSEVVARDYKRFLKVTYRYVRKHTSLMRRVAHFSFYERLFALWHVLHYPIFLLLIVSALFHVLAVHMY